MRVLDSTTHLKLKNILYATDLSPTAERALPYALGIARRYGSTVYAVHVIQPDVYPLVPRAEWPNIAQQEESLQRKTMSELETHLASVSHEVLFRTGNIWPVFSATIREKQIDLLVLSTHGRTGLGKVLLGSVAEEVFRKAPCPVLTVGPATSSKPTSSAELSHILYATDFSAESLRAVPHAISLAREHRAHLILLHSFEDGGDARTMLRTLRDLVPFGADLRCEPTCVAERGPHADKILAIARAHGADMIVLGVADTKAHLEHKGHRSALYKIITNAPCPVLTVRA